MRLLQAAVPLILGASALRIPQQQVAPRDEDVQVVGFLEPQGSIDTDAAAKCHCPPSRTVTVERTVTVGGAHEATEAPGRMKPWKPEHDHDHEKPGEDTDKVPRPQLPPQRPEPEPPVARPEPPSPRPERPGGDSGRGERRNVVYFTNWGIYGKNYQPHDLADHIQDITHLLYAFAKIASDGTVQTSDSFSDTEKQWTDASQGYTATYDSTQGNLHGCVRELFNYKAQNRQLKLLLSVGGWTYSQDERQFNHVATPEGRQRFAQSATKLVADWGFDGIDIDWEYPNDATEARNYVLLLQACREALDTYAAQHAPGYHFLLTVASPAGPSRYAVMDLEGMDRYVDQWHLMAYDYAGSWDMTSGHQSNLFANPANLESTKFSTEKAVDDYIARGIHPSKIVMGLPLYGRAFENADDIGGAYSGVPSGEQVYEGTYLYKDLPRPNAQEVFDDAAVAAYSYDPNRRELISYDTVQSAQAKTRWAMEKGLGGMVFWEAAGDKTGDQSLIRTTSRTMGGLDGTQNLLSYPASQFSNIRSVAAAVS